MTSRPHTDRSAMDKRPTPCYRLGGIVYVPDYERPGIYRGPDGLAYAATGLERAHAVRVTEMLWPRE